MLKKISAVILCIFLLLCLLACENNAVIPQGGTDISQPETQPDKPLPTMDVFHTENIVRITFFGYYGEGTPVEVPSENMEEIIAWLDSFTLEEEILEDVVPGNNTWCVEIEYSDGAFVKQGLSSIKVGDTGYYLDYDQPPECFKKLISQSILEI
ncbi:MAG: hypothetical protein E7606_03635 [Ruminococcaceae bacterium]|nr:hypothetical protein [Oscillospiraceae bacterium]